MLYNKSDIYKYSLFSSTISECNKLNLKMQQSKTLLTFRNALIKIGSSITKPMYNFHNPVVLKLLAWLSFGLSDPKQHKFDHNFQDYLNKLCSCCLEVESVSHFFLLCHHYFQPCQMNYIQLIKTF